MQLLLDQDNAHLPLPPVERTQLPDIVAALGEVHPDRRGDAIGEAGLARSRSTKRELHRRAVRRRRRRLLDTSHLITARVICRQLHRY